MCALPPGSDKGGCRPQPGGVTSTNPDAGGCSECSRSYDYWMALKPYCAQPEWIARAGRELMNLLPGMTVRDAARIVVDDLWPDTCDLRPEEAAELWVMRQGDD